MAALVLGLAGAGVGSMFGMTSLGWTLGSAVGNMFFGPKPPDQEGPRLTDTTVTSSTYGSDIPQLFGTVRVAGNAIWSTNKIETVHRQEIKSGGKGAMGGGGGGDQITYTYHVNLAVAVGDGLIRGVRNIWCNGKLVYTVGSAETTQVPGPNGELVSQTVYTATAEEVEADNAAQTDKTFYLGTEDQMPDATIQSWLPHPVPAYRGTSYVVFQNFQLQEFGNMVPNFEFEVIAQASATTGSIVGYFCQKSGLTEDQYDVSQLTQPVQGYSIATRGPARAALEPLANIFFFDAAQSVDESQTMYLKFVPRGGEIRTTIPESALAAHEPGSAMPDQLKKTRKNEEELPQEISLVFKNRNNNYQNGTQPARRQVTRSKTQVKLDVPIVLLDSDAKGIAQTLLHAAWVSRTAFSFRTSRAYSQYEATDIVGVANNGVVYTIRITEKNDSKPGIIEWTGEFEDTGQWSYTPNNNLDRFNAPTSFIQDPGDVNDPVIFGAPSQLTPTGFEIWIGASSADPEWGGCDVWLSTDDLYFTTIGRLHSRSIQGVLSAILPIGAALDDVHTLSVNLVQSEGELVTVSQDQVNRDNSLTYVDGELIAYKTSTPTTAHQFNLTYLKRGVYNTPIAAHPIGAPFLYLGGEILRHQYNPRLLGETVYFRFTSFNTHRLALQDVAGVQSYEFVVGGSISHPDNTSGITATKLADGRIRLTIVPVSDPRIKRYEVRVGATAWEVATPVGSITEPTTTLDIPAQPVGVYTFQSKAVSDNGQYSYTAVTTSITISSPLAPTALTATTNGLFFVDLAWTYAVGQTDRSAVEIYAATVNDRTSATIVTRLLPSAVRYKHNGLSSGVDWFYWILVYDNANNASAFYPASLTAGVNGHATTDPSAILALLQNSVNLSQLHPDIAARIQAVITDENIAHQSGEAFARADDAAEAALTLLLHTDEIKTAVDREKWISDATAVVDPATGKVTILATANITTDVDAHLHTVDLSIDAIQGTLGAHTTSINNIGAEVDVHETRLDLAEDSLALKVESTYVDTRINETLTGLDPELVGIASQTGAEAILRALIDADFGRRQAQRANAVNAIAQQTLDVHTEALRAEAVERIVVAAQAANALAAVVAETSSRTSADNANAQVSTDILARLNVGDFATVKSNALAAVTATGSQATLISDISARLNVGDFATVKSTVNSLVTSTGATATAVSDVQARLDIGDFAAVKTSANASVTRLGVLEARWSLKVQAGNKVAGMEILATGATSSIAVLADQFLFLKPDGTGTPVQVMTIGTVGGVSALGFSGNLIIDQSIVASRIDTRGLSIKDASGNIIFSAGVPIDYNAWIANKPTSLSMINSTEGTRFATIETGATAGANYATNVTNRPTSLSGINGTEGAKLAGIETGATAGANYATNVTNRPVTLSSINGTEGAKLAGIQDGADVTSSHTAASIAGQGAFATLSQITGGNVSTFIANVAIGNAQIGGSLFSDNYLVGTSGWAIAKDGSAEFNNGLFRGVLAAATGTFGTVAIAPGGYVRMGQTAWDTGEGLYIGDSGGVAAMSFYDSTTGDFLRFKPGQGLTWSGQVLEYKPGSFVAASSDAFKAVPVGGSLVLLKEIIVAKAGTIRVDSQPIISMSVAGATTNTQGHLYTQIQIFSGTGSFQRNGPLNDWSFNESRTASTGTHPGPANSTDIVVAAGDLVRVYGRLAGTSGSGSPAVSGAGSITYNVSNFRIKTLIPPVEVVTLN